MAEILIKIKTNNRPARGNQGIRWKVTVAVLGVLAAVISLATAYLKSR